MRRCIELARKGAGFTAPNPMVGCVIVQGKKIIGESYHKALGEAHAEVNAIFSVKDKNLLPDSTLYVNLEPCSHLGKTPPCSSLIIAHKIPRVVIGTQDPNPLVAGSGINQLMKAGLKVNFGVLEAECHELNRRFFTFHTKKRPYIILKWARTEDGFIDRHRKIEDERGVNWITGMEARQWVHQWRSREQAILVGTRTAILDDPELTVREWHGRNPLRLVIDRKGKLPPHLKVFNDQADTHIFIDQSHGKPQASGNTDPVEKGSRIKYISVPEERDYIDFILDYLYGMEIQSLLVEGGAKTIKSFQQAGLWDEARVFTGKKKFGEGIIAPDTVGKPVQKLFPGDDFLEIFRNA